MQSATRHKLWLTIILAALVGAAAVAIWASGFGFAQPVEGHGNDGAVSRADVTELPTQSRQYMDCLIYVYWDLVHAKIVHHDDTFDLPKGAHVHSWKTLHKSVFNSGIGVDLVARELCEQHRPDPPKTFTAACAHKAAIAFHETLGVHYANQMQSMYIAHTCIPKISITDIYPNYVPPTPTPLPTDPPNDPPNE